MNTQNSPNYKKIYSDLIERKYPERKQELEPFLRKEKLSMMDVIMISNKLMKNAGNEVREMNQKLRSYDRETIIEMLKYQKKYKLSNSQLANQFSLSRNTVTKWKKNFNNIINQPN